ncbi:hypothetical protein BUE80_DR011855, partial [Diplocarpon rosae]
WAGGFLQHSTRTRRARTRPSAQPSCLWKQSGRFSQAAAAVVAVVARTNRTDGQDFKLGSNRRLRDSRTTIGLLERSTSIMPPADLKINTDLAPRPRRSRSVSSDRPSLGGYGGLLSPPVIVSPDPAFIAASSASQIVTNGLESRARTCFDQHAIEPSGEPAAIAPPALSLINQFLDYVLFNFLSVSRSTSLAALRPAVGEVLRPKLAKEAIAGADQELHEYLGGGGGGGGEEEDMLAMHPGLEPDGGWDLDLVWKRTRLRCMVYSSLGDMEEEDEDFYMEREIMNDSPGSANRDLYSPGVVSPAVAIFLTSILEHLGEQVLAVAGQAASYRWSTQREHEETEGSHTPADLAERVGVVVEDTDMERVALDRTLGRLWRGWKKRIRSSPTSAAMAPSSWRDPPRQASCAGSIAPEEAMDAASREPSAAATWAENVAAALIPLPLNENDTREIEIPGLARQSDDEASSASEDEVTRLPRRPRSMMHVTPGCLSPAASPSKRECPALAASGSRHRSNSLPSALPLSPQSAPRQKPPVAEWSAGAALATQAPQEPVVTARVPAAEPSVADQERAADGNEGVGAGMAPVVAAIGATAVAAIVAAAYGEAPPHPGVADPDDHEGEDFLEEPQIMTSSRVPIFGGVSADDGRGTLTRRSSDRSPSNHSLRVIELTRSRNGSTDVSDHVVVARPMMVSRPSSLSSPVVSEVAPRMGSPISRAPTASPIPRQGSSSSRRRARNSTGESISEVDEKQLADLDPATPILADDTTDPDHVPAVQTPSSFYDEAPTFFGLAPAPVSRAARGVTRAPLIEEPTPQLCSALTDGSQTAASPGAPPLTPLRDMVEGARETSGRLSPQAPSIGAHSVHDKAPSPHSPSASTSMTPYYRLAAPVDSQAPHRESPGLRPFSPRTGAPESTGKGQRSLHTSGSWSSSSSQKVRAVRTSNESVARSVDPKGQSFEDLMRSDQTIQYTLTSQNMQDIEASPDSPRYNPPLPRTPIHHSNSSSLASFTKGTGLKSSPQSSKSLGLFEPLSRPQFGNAGSRLRPKAPQARDARVDRDSISDFAEFIRSTGPANSYETAPTRPPALNRSANGAPRNFSVSGSPRVGPASSVPKRAASSAGRSKLQARDAAVPRDDSVSDLIDFVRSGPQLERQDHRIPRTVAPFRSTMDSDQMAGAIGGKAIDASLPDLHFSPSAFADGPDVRASKGTSLTGSVNSQSALLGSSRKPPTPKSQNTFEEQDMMPKRKTRRIRDPYAVDYSGEEDDDSPPARPQPIKEESLADFLRNVPPPPAPVSESASQPGSSKLKKKPSSTSLIARFGRNGSASGPSGPPTAQSKSTESPRTRKASSHTPIAAKYSITPYQKPRNPNSAPQLDSAGRSNSKVAQKSYQPREAAYTARSQTSDLASFLLSSEPPSNRQTQSQVSPPALQKEETSAFSRIFGRKKAH